MKKQKDIILQNQIGNLPFAIFSDTRPILMGIATLMIVLFHSYMNPDIYVQRIFNIQNFSFTAIISNFSFGVDAFLFLSGFGLYFSWQNNPNLKDFYKKRIVRIIPELFIVMTIWNVLSKINLSILDYLKSITFIDFWIYGKRYFWYFALLLVLYLIYPLIHMLYNKFQKYGFLCLFLFSYIIIALFYIISPNRYNIIEIALYRVPVFLVGVWFGKNAFEKKSFPKFWVWISVFLVILLSALYGMGNFTKGSTMRISESVFGIAIMFIFAALFQKSKVNFVRSFLIWFGGYSMEIYLLYENVYDLFGGICSFNDESKILQGFCYLVITIVLAIILKNICKSLNNELFYRNKNKA